MENGQEIQGKRNAQCDGEGRSRQVQLGKSLLQNGSAQSKESGGSKERSADQALGRACVPPGTKKRVGCANNGTLCSQGKPSLATKRREEGRRPL